MELGQYKCEVCPHKQKWIPVSEREPEHDGYYLATYRFVIGKGKLIAHELYFSEDYGWCLDEDSGGTENNGFGVEMECIAWMTLPEPYKEGDQDG